MTFAGDYHYAVGPTAALLVVGMLGLVSRWAWGRRPQQRRPDYGLLVEVARFPQDTAVAAACARLRAAGVRTTLGAVPAHARVSADGRAVATAAGTAVLVFPADAERARTVLRTPAGAPVADPAPTDPR